MESVFGDKPMKLGRCSWQRPIRSDFSPVRPAPMSNRNLIYRAAPSAAAPA